MSLKSKTTDWFPGTKTPARIGVYQREFSTQPPCIRFSYWDGYRWGRLEMSPHIAEQNKASISCYQKLRWRGLTEEGK